MLATTPNKRKSGNQNDSPQFSKKFKPGGTPKKPNGTPQQTPNQRKQNQTPKPNTPGKGATPGKSFTPGKKELASPSPNTPKLEMFSGTSNLNSSQKANAKKEPFSAKKEPVNTGKQPAKQAGGQKELANAGKQGNKGKPKPNSAGDSEEQLNRHKRRRETMKHKRVESRGKFKQIINQVVEGDAAARRELEEKVKELEKIPEKSKNCQKKINSYKRILSGNAKPNNSNQQQKPKQNNQQIKGAPKNQPANQQKPAPQKQQKNKQNQLIKETVKVPQQPGGKRKQNLEIKKVEQAESDSEEEDDEVSGEVSDDEVAVSSDDDEVAVASDDDEAAVASDDDEEASDEDEVAAASDEEVSNEDSSEENEGEEEQQESSEGDDEEGSGEEDDEVEGGSGEEEEDSDDDNAQVPQKKNKPTPKQQGANKNKQETTVNDVTGKKSRYVVFVGNLPYTANKEEITEHFKKVGDVVDIRIPTDQKTKKPRGFAYIELNNEEGYQRALSLNHTFLGGRRINVLYTQGGKKKSENQKNEMKAKNLKLQGMRKQGLLTGSVKADQKRSVRRAKKQQFEKKEGA